MALSVFGSAPAGLTAFSESAGGGDDFRLVEHVGEVLIITVHGPKEVATAAYGVKTAISCDVVALAANAEPAVYKDVLIFNAAPVDQLRGSAGQTVVAAVELYETKQKSKAPRLAAPSPEGMKAAEAYEAARS